MNTAVIVIHVLAVVTLVLTVLLQTNRGAGLGAAFGGSGASFGARGPATLIGKITCAAAVVFMCTSLFLAIVQSGKSVDTVMSGYVETSAGTSEMEWPPVQTEAAGTGAGADQRE